MLEERDSYTYEVYNAFTMKEQKLKQIFIWIVAISGFILVFLTPPLAVPDENTHFINAYCTSRLNLFPDVNPENGAIGKYLPKYIAVFTEKYCEKYSGRLKEGYSFTENYFDSWLPVSQEDREAVFWQNDLVTINPWSYVVSGIGMRITSIICTVTGGGFDNAYNLLIAGRMFNLIFYVLIGYWAISISPCLKKVMMLLLSMPISLFLGASLSYDALLIPVSMLLFAELMRLFIDFEQNKVNRRDMFIVFFCTLFLTAIKTAYAPFLILLILVPIKKYKSFKQYGISIGVVGIAGCIGLIIPKILTMFAMKNSVQTTNPNIIIQKEYLLQHICEFPSIICNTFIKYSNFYLSSFVAKLGQLDTNFPIIYIGVLVVILTIVTLYECCNVGKIDWKIKSGAVVTTLIVIIGIFVAMYITWTPRVEKPCGQTVSGVQGRYFIPVFCFASVLIFNNIGNKIPDKINSVICHIAEHITIFFVILNCLLTVLFLLLRYWCN